MYGPVHIYGGMRQPSGCTCFIPVSYPPVGIIVSYPVGICLHPFHTMFHTRFIPCTPVRLFHTPKFALGQMLRM